MTQTIIDMLGLYHETIELIQETEDQIREETPMLQMRLKTLEWNKKDLKEGMKDKAKYIPLDKRQAQVGDGYQLVPTNGRLQAAKLERLARQLGATEEQLQACKGSPNWSLRRA